MDGYLGQGGMAMARGTLARVEDGRGLLLSVWDGELWLTQQGDSRDYFLRAGQRFRLDRDGVALVYALRNSRITLSAPPVADEEAQSGRLEQLRRRLAQAWANTFAPLSRPTSAAL